MDTQVLQERYDFLAAADTQLGWLAQVQKAPRLLSAQLISRAIIDLQLPGYGGRLKYDCSPYTQDLVQVYRLVRVTRAASP